MVGLKLQRLLVTFFVSALSPYAHAEFFPVAPNLKRLNLSQALAQTSLRLDVFDKKGEISDNCTAVAVSDHGHILTAAHCLKNCLLEAGAFNGDDGKTQQYTRYEKLPTTCHVRINEIDTTLSVLATDDCLDPGLIYAHPDPTCMGLDLVLGQIPSKLAPVCAVLSTSTSPQFAFTLSYPHQKTGRLVPGEVKDFTQYFSEGKTLSFIPTCEKKVRAPERPGDEQPGVVPLGISKVIAMYEHETALGRLVQMTVDVVKGSSGAPVFDRDGRIMGLVQGFSVKRHNEYRECAGATFMSPFNVTNILDRFPSLDLKSALNCSIKRAN